MKITIEIDEMDAAAILADCWKHHYDHAALVHAIEQLVQEAAQRHQRAFGTSNRVRQIRFEIENQHHAPA